MSEDEPNRDFANPTEWRGYVMANLKSLVKSADRLEDKYDKHCVEQEKRFDEVEKLINEKMGKCPYHDEIVENAKEIKGLKGNIFYWYLLVGFFTALAITALINSFKEN